MAIYYVKPDGSDNQSGLSDASAWKTWGKAFNSGTAGTTPIIAAGDIVYFKGGTYTKNISDGPSWWYYPDRGYPQYGTGYRVSRNGSEGNYIKYWADPSDYAAGNYPILDCSGAIDSSAQWNWGIYGNCSHVHFKGLHLKNVMQALPEPHAAFGIQLSGHDVIFENCATYDNWGAGFRSGADTSGNFYFINCDSYHNIDYLSSSLPGNDGYGFSVIESNGNNYFTGCRAWHNGDDGFNVGILYEIFKNQYVQYNNCWSFHNGELEGGGSGFKMGWDDFTDGSVKTAYYNCIAADNRWNGWKTNDYYAGSYAINSRLYNNLAYHNGWQGSGATYLAPYYGFEIHYTDNTDASKLLRVLKNNISYNNETGPVGFDGVIYTHNNNSWDSSLRDIVNADFISLDVSQLFRPRKSNGALPDVSFGHLTANASLKYAGVWVDVSLDGAGLPWKNPPSMGAFEYGYSAPSIDTSLMSLIYTVSASCGGRISSDGSVSMIMAGICISTNANPTVRDVSTKDSSAVGVWYSSSLITLNASTHYHVRAYAYNSLGVAYGIDVSFNTLPLNPDGSIFFVAPNGSDNYDGTNIAKPWRTWVKAFNTTEVSAGAIVYFKGGTYYKTLNDAPISYWYYPDRTSHATGYNIRRSGIAGKWIKYWAYPPDFEAGNPPILDCSFAYDLDSSLNYGIRNGAPTISYVHFKGLITQNVKQIRIGSTFPVQSCYGWGIGGSNIIIENCVFRNIWGKGIEFGGAPSPNWNHMINCDAYECCDYLTIDDTSISGDGPGNDGEGFFITGGGNLNMYHCRTWRCGDQGFALGIITASDDPTQYVVVDGCWSFWNGMMTGLGHGFTLGWIAATDGSLKRTIKNNIGAYNRYEAFFTLDYKYPYPVYMNMYNNIGYHNGYQGTAGWGSTTPGYFIQLNNTLGTDASEYLRTLRNNISFDNCTGDVNLGSGAKYTHSNNTWDIPISVSTCDFVRLASNASEGIDILRAPRKINGDLPDLNGFLHLTANSSLIHAGIWVDVSFDGEGNLWYNPPSLGAFEYTGNIYYVATNGSDSYPGTISQPWATWKKGFETAIAGDTVYFRGGTYAMTDLTGFGIMPSFNSGTEDNPIRFFNYPGEIPILDCSNVIPTGSTNHGIRSDTTYCHFKGLTIGNVLSVEGGYAGASVICYGWIIEASSTIIENCTIYNVHGVGFWSQSSYNLRHINCDAYSCSDIYALPPQLPGNYGTGFGTYGSITDGDIHYYHCRAWDCGDQGFMSVSNSYTEYDGCWSFRNGQLQGLGHGYKLGYVVSTVDYINILQRKVINCLATYNKAEGFSTNDQARPAFSLHIYNNTSYKNNNGFYVYDNNGDASAEYYRVLRNNIAYGNTSNDFGQNMTAVYTHSNNTWDSSLRTTVASDFVSLDASQLIRPRKSDGSLPDVSFGHLTANSSMIYAGIYLADVSLDGEGKPWQNPPSLGAFEYSYSIPSIDTSIMSLIYTVSASCGGRISADGSLSIIKAGICVSTNINPTVRDVSTKDSSAVGVWYSSSLTGLNPSTHYHVRAYAYNSLGVAYGADVSFNTYPSDVSIYFVAVDGSDSRTASQAKNPATPWRTIQNAAYNVSSGDMVIVKSGKYPHTTQYMCSITTSGTTSKPITFKSESKHGAVLDGSSSITNGIAFGISASNIIIDGFEIKGFISVAFNANNWAETEPYPENITIKNCHIHHNGKLCTDDAFGHGSMYMNAIRNITINNNIFNDEGRYAPGENGCSGLTTLYYTNHDHAIYIANVSTLTIYDNIFYNNDNGWSIHLVDPPTYNVRIYNNTFDYGNHWGSSGAYGSHVILGSATNVEIKNNIFNDCENRAIYLYNSPTYSNVVISYNIAYGGAGDIAWIATGFPVAGTTISNNLTNTNPLVIGRDNYNFALSSTSPAIHAGTNVGLSYDYTGIPWYNPPSIGAYEYDGSTSDSSTAIYSGHSYGYRIGNTMLRINNSIITLRT